MRVVALSPPTGAVGAHAPAVCAAASAWVHAVPSYLRAAAPPLLRARSELHSREVKVEGINGLDDSDDFLEGYLTEEAVPDDSARERPSRALVLLPGANGWRCGRTRRLADRLAIFCLCLVLVPDLHRGSAPYPVGQSPPASRVAEDVRSSAIYLRADHRVGALALIGAGLGGASLMMRALSEDAPAVGAAAGVALCCPSPGVRPDELAALPPSATASSVPLLLLFDRTSERDDAAAASARASLGLSDGDGDGDGADAPVVIEGAAATAEPAWRLAKLRVAELRERLADLGASVEGRKAALIERLVQVQQQAPTASAPPAQIPAIGSTDRMVVQYRGLAAAYCGDADGVADGATEAEAEAEAEDEAWGTPWVDEVPAEDDEAENGLILAEAWLNLHLDQAQAARTQG